MRHIKIILFFLLFTSCDFVLESEGTGSFSFSNQLNPFYAEKVDHGLTRLFENTTNCQGPSECLLSNQRKKILEEVWFIKEKHDRQIQESFVQHQGKMPFTYQTYSGPQTKLTKVQFPSFYQRPGNHPANQVHGWFLTPQDHGNCRSKLPTVFILHHIYDDIKPEMQLSQFLLQMGQRMNTFILFLPYYGPRRVEGEDFLVPSYDKLKENFTQAVLDVRLAREWLLQNPRVDAQRMMLYGLSLGSIVGILSAGFDNLFPKYSFLGAGGDFANILFTNLRIAPNDSFSQRFAPARWNESETRLNLAAVDPIVWAPLSRQADIQMFYSPNDELMDPEGSIGKVRNEFSFNNKVRLYPYSGGHRPKFETLTSKLKVFRELFIPLYGFAIEGTTNPPSRCGGPF